MPGQHLYPQAAEHDGMIIASLYQAVWVHGIAGIRYVSPTHFLSFFPLICPQPVHRIIAYNRAELEMEKGSCHFTQIKSQMMRIVNTGSREMTFSVIQSHRYKNREGQRRRTWLQWRSPGLSCSATAAKMCSTMSDGVALLSPLNGNESD